MASVSATEPAAATRRSPAPTPSVAPQAAPVAPSVSTGALPPVAGQAYVYPCKSVHLSPLGIHHGHTHLLSPFYRPHSPTTPLP